MSEQLIPAVTLSRNETDAVLFDMDGVVTRTASVHAAAWKRTFDEYIEALSKPGPFQPFDIEGDYLRYVDGKARYDGVISFLSSRGIQLPYGQPDDPPLAATVCGLGNRKDRFFLDLITRDGVEVFESSLRLIQRLKQAGFRTGIFSASRNAETVLRAAGVLEIFDARVDGKDAERLDLPGKPAPAMLLELASRLGAKPGRAVIVEDAIAGVQAGRAGGFRLVIGVNRGSTVGMLIGNGANLEVRDLCEVGLDME